MKIGDTILERCKHCGRLCNCKLLTTIIRYFPFVKDSTTYEQDDATEFTVTKGSYHEDERYILYSKQFKEAEKYFREQNISLRFAVMGKDTVRCSICHGISEIKWGLD